MIISADTSAREAEQGGMQPFDRLCFLLLHGILHLCGYDHERSGEAEADRMEQEGGGAIQDPEEGRVVKPNRFIDSANCAIEGILHAARTEKHMRDHFIVRPGGAAGWRCSCG